MNWKHKPRNQFRPTVVSSTSSIVINFYRHAIPLVNLEQVNDSNSAMMNDDEQSHGTNKLQKQEERG